MFVEAYLDLRKNNQSSTSQIVILRVKFLKASLWLAFKKTISGRRFAPPTYGFELNWALLPRATHTITPKAKPKVVRVIGSPSIIAEARIVRNG